MGGVESPLVLLNGRFFLFFGLLVLFRRFSLREELREGGGGGKGDALPWRAALSSTEIMYFC